MTRPHRNARPRAVRAKTTRPARVPKYKRLALRQLEPDDGKRRLPLTRGECEEDERPCPFVSCKYHLFLDVSRYGTIKWNFPDLLERDGTPLLDEMPATCALDVAAEDGITLSKLGQIFNVTREWARQMIGEAGLRLREKSVIHELALLRGLRADSDATIDLTDEPESDEPESDED